MCPISPPPPAELRKFPSLVGARLGLLLVLLLCLPACTAPQSKTGGAQYMFWPPAPDAPHVQFLTSLSSSKDITQKQTGVEDILYGKDKFNGLPFYRPYGIRMAGGCIYVCDASSGNVSVLDIRKKEVRVLGTTGQTHLAKPIDIAIAAEGTKYVADVGHGAILVYDKDDKYAGKVAVKGMRPVSVAVTADKLYVSDIAASLVRVFDRFNGKVLQSIGGPGGGNGKLGGAMGLCLDAQGNIYVNDVIGCRVQKFSPEGKFLLAIGGLGNNPGQFVRPKHMAVDSAGILYVVDNAFQNVQVFNAQAKVLTSFGGAGTFPGAMDMPAGICVSDQDLDLFAQYVHPAFQAQRLVIVTDNAGPKKINVYALGELKPGKTIADIAGNRIKGMFGFDTQPAVGVLDLPHDATGAASEPGATTAPATGPGATSAPAATTGPTTQPDADPKRP